LGDSRNIFLSEEFLHNIRCVARCVMQKQMSLPLPPNCTAQPLQILHVKMTSSNTVYSFPSRWSELQPG
jgi:hypothetical protein